MLSNLKKRDLSTVSKSNKNQKLTSKPDLEFYTRPTINNWPCSIYGWYFLNRLSNLRLFLLNFVQYTVGGCCPIYGWSDYYVINRTLMTLILRINTNKKIRRKNKKFVPTRPICVICVLFVNRMFPAPSNQSQLKCLHVN